MTKLLNFTKGIIYSPFKEKYLIVFNFYKIIQEFLMILPRISDRFKPLLKIPIILRVKVLIKNLKEQSKLIYANGIL